MAEPWTCHEDREGCVSSRETRSCSAKPAYVSDSTETQQAPSQGRWAEIVLARIDRSWRRSPLTRTIVPFVRCAQDNPLRTVVLFIHTIVPATEKVSKGHDPLTATIAPAT